MPTFPHATPDLATSHSHFRNHLYVNIINEDSPLFDTHATLILIYLLPQLFSFMVHNYYEKKRMHITLVNFNCQPKSPKSICQNKTFYFHLDSFNN